MSNNINIEQYLGVNIKDICENEFDNNATNHCAHVVGHLLGFNFGYTCYNQKGKGLKEAGAPIRVDSIFNKCTSVGSWADKPVTMLFCLAFVTLKTNVKLATDFMDTNPKKHIGILRSGYVYHYSNGQNKVVKQSPATFAYHYGSSSNYAMYYGEIPKNQVGKNWPLVP